MGKKLLIFGGGGFVGGNMAEIAWQKGWQVNIADSFYRDGLPDTEWKIADITDKASIEKAFEEVQPDAVVNVAAIADIDRAEREKELARRVNVDGARYIAESCKKYKSRYVFFSSDAVFDGEGQCYTEDVKPDPVNYYGKTKAEAEQEVRAACEEAVIVRLSLVIGFPVAGGNSFLAALENKLKEGCEIVCPVDEIRTPIDVLTLSESVLELAEGSFCGVLHLGATDSLDRYRLTRMAAVKMGYDPEAVKPQGVPLQTAGRASRHKNGILCVDKARSILKTPLLSTEDGMNRAFREQFKGAKGARHHE